MYSSFVANLIVYCMLAAILLSLGYGLFSLLYRNRSGRSVYKALAWRISLSLLLFLGLIIAVYFHYINPGPPPL